MKNLFNIRTRREVEIHRRMRLSVAAYAYEFDRDHIMTDHEFDAESRLVDLSIDTGNVKMDAWFRENFDPSTGQWIHKHPEFLKVRGIYERFHAPPQSR